MRSGGNVFFLQPLKPLSLTHSRFPAHINTNDIKNNISAANPSAQWHVERTVGFAVPISSLSTAVFVKVYLPLCILNHPRPVLEFWPTIQQLSEFAYFNASDESMRVESQELLAQLSSWAATLLPVLNDGRLKSELKLLSFLGSRVPFRSGADGLLCGWGGQRWLISARGGPVWVQSTDIVAQAD